MNHQPFETWLLEDRRSLSEEQQQSLQQHLEVCSDCRALRGKWQEVAQELRLTPMVAPRPGFARRFQAGMAERRVREQRRQAWRVFIALSGSAAAVFGGFMIYALFFSTTAEWIQAVVTVLSSTVGTAATARSLFSTWMEFTPFSLNLTLWISIGLTFCFLVFLWVFAIWRTSLIGVMNK
jgi:hypothetical protein